MYKPLRYESLSDLIQEFAKSYESYYHEVVEVNFGLPFSHNRVSETPLQWKVMRLSRQEGFIWQDYADTFKRYCKDCSLIASYFEATGIYPQWCNAEYRRGGIIQKSSFVQGEKAVIVLM